MHAVKRGGWSYAAAAVLLAWCGAACGQGVEPGTVLAWGSDGYCQAEPPPEMPTGIVMVAGGWEHSAALTAGGRVLAWGGWNGSGECTVPAEAKTGVVAVAVGGDHTVALTGAGRVLVWGWGAYNITAVPAEAETGVVAIAAGINHTVALTGAGRVLAWGRNNQLQCDVPPEAQTGIVAIAAGDEHSMALTAGGRVLAWGYNQYGQCDVPEEAQSNIVAVAGCWLSSMALTADGRVLVWSSAGSDFTTIPEEARGAVQAISARAGTSAALTATGGVVVWTGGWGGGVVSTPAIAKTGVTAIAAGKMYALAISSISNAMPAAPIPSNPTNGLFNVNLQPILRASAFSDADGGDVHTQTQWQVYTSVNFSVVSYIGYGFDAKRPAETEFQVPPGALETNKVYYWRVRYQDQRLGWSPWSEIWSFATQEGSSPPLKPSLTGPTNGALAVSLTPWLKATPFSDPDPGDTHAVSQWQVAAEETFAAPLWDSGAAAPTNRIRCPPGVLPPNASSYARVRYRDNRNAWSAWSEPCRFSTILLVRILEPATEEDTWSGTNDVIAVSGIATSQYGLVAIELVNDRDGVVRPCAGTSAWSCTNAPLQPGMNILTVTGRDARGAESSDTLAAYRGIPGGVTVWGTNDTGQTNVPAEALSGITVIAAGRDHIVAVKGGRVLAWGKNTSGQCEAPHEASNGVCAVSAGAIFTLALRGGRVYAWGDSTYLRDMPEEAEAGVDAIAAGQFHSLALKKGRVLAWGDNLNGQCDVPAAASNGILAVAAGRFHSAAVTTGGAVVAWGENTAGQCMVPEAASNGVIAVAAFNSGTAALKANGAVLAWGNFWDYGLLPVPEAATSGVIAIAAGGMQRYGIVALKANGQVIGWGNITNPPAPAAVRSVAVACGGDVAAALVPPVAVSNAPPFKPVLKSPAAGAVVATRTPTLRASAFADPDPGDTFAASRWQAAGKAGFSAPVWDSGAAAPVREIAVPADRLKFNVTYNWRVRYQDSAGAWSAWSEPRSLSTLFTGLYVNCGGPALKGWSSDNGCSLGSCITSATAVANATAAPAALYRTARIGPRLIYRFAEVPNGLYRVALHFSEPVFNAAGKRLFWVRINGVTVLSSFDIRAAAGAKNRALVRAFNIRAQGGVGLTIEAKGLSGTQALICGIAVAPVDPADSGAPVAAAPAGLPSAPPIPPVRKEAAAARTPRAWAGGGDGTAGLVAQVLDGNLNTVWRGLSGGAPWSLTLDLGRCEPLLEVEVVFGDTAWPGWSAVGSADLSSWYDLLAVTNRPVWCRYLVLSFPPPAGGAESPAVREIRWRIQPE